jgi:glutamate/tyrosine decarboxylase-like PLP-dependent enzyme
MDDQGVDVWHAGPIGAFVEEEVIRWLCDLVGYPEGSFGILTSGGVLANFLALTVARDVHLARLRGTPGDPPPRGRALEGVRVYASGQAHFSIARALDELGFPPETLCLLPVDERYRLQAAPVAKAVTRDRAAGLVPLAIAAVAGTTNTGSVDALADLADLADREGLWFHVDAAYGGAARLSSTLAARVPALERADTITVDPHKWFFQAYDIGALVVKRQADLLSTFHRSPEYYRGGQAAGLGDDEAAIDVEPLNFYQHGMEGSRRWRALKLWFSWKHLGTTGLARLVEMNVEIAGYLLDRIRDSDDFEAEPAEPDLSVVCFRYLPGGRAKALSLDPTVVDANLDRLASALEASGEGWLSTTRLRGRTYLRAGVVNYLTSEADIDRLLATLRALAVAIR